MLIIKHLKKALLVSSMCFPLFVCAQSAVKPNWYNLDLKTDGVFGISTEKAYTELLKDKKHVPVLVAVIDGGEDINHEDLKSVLWNNPGEIAGNNIDDDKNGFIDDVHGWSFIGSPTKGNVMFDNMEMVRLIKHQAPKYEGIDPSTLKKEDEAGYKNYLAMKAEREKLFEQHQKRLGVLTRFKTALSEIMATIKKENPAADDFKNYKPTSDTQSWVRKTMVNALAETDYAAFIKEEIDGPYERAWAQLNYHLNQHRFLNEAQIFHFV
ncbi:MAG: hypothetical protein EOP47_22160 [Sphingobacteriaceae bacterium]|nr:MAG: hypothetical protein EOP47_22160 [Sphingobacteriaceae bacterium]